MAKILLSKPPPLTFHSLHQHARTNISSSLLLSSISNPSHLCRCFLHPPPPTRPIRLLFTVRAVESSSMEREEEKVEAGDGALRSVNASKPSEEFPSGEFEMEELGLWRQSLVKLRMLIAPPWQRVKKGSVLSMKLRGEISDQLKSRFASGLSLPQICENFYKAAYDLVYPVRLVELSKPSPSLQDVLTGIGSSLIGIDKAAKLVLNDMSAISGVQARMDSITFEGLGEATDAERILALIKDFQ